MALKADSIALGTKPKRVRIVTIAAGNTVVKHSALDKRAVLIYFVLDLAIRKIETFFKQRDPLIVTDGLIVHAVFVNLTAA